MRAHWILHLGAIWWVLWGGADRVWSQEGPDTVLYNGKVVTVDNHDVNSDLGTIAQAIAIREGKIAAVGTNSQIRALAKNNTKSIDLKGRTVLPGFISTHDHPQYWDTLNPYILKKVITDDMHIERFLNGPPNEQLEQLPRVLEQAVRQAKPGQWIRISMLPGEEFTLSGEISGFFGKQINKQQLDLAAPNNPVSIRAPLGSMVVNDYAIREVKKYWGQQYGDIVVGIGRTRSPGEPQNNSFEQTGMGGTSHRFTEPDVVYYKNNPEAWVKILEYGLSWLAGYGVTTDATMLYYPAELLGYRILEKQKRMAIRFMWAYIWGPLNHAFDDPYFLADMSTRVGEGSDYFWFAGASPTITGSCSTLPGTSPEVKSREECRLEAGSEAYKWTYNFVKAGGRVALIHTAGDKDIDYFLEIIEQASKEAGMSPEEIRAKRHGYDHMMMSPRPDQIPKLKNLGMITGGTDLWFYEGQAKRLLTDYGERAVEWLVPRKRVNSAGIRNSVEVDRALGHTNLTFFTILYSGMTRKDWEGKVTGPPDLAVDREAMLKSGTLWGAYHALREDTLGSLETGKWADLIVTDRDYLTVPMDQIPKLRVLMTMVGGKIVHVVPSLAREVGLQPTGAQVELGGLSSQW